MQDVQTIEPPAAAPLPEALVDETYRVREAVALFPDEARLELAIVALQEQGVDRARLSVLARMPSAEGETVTSDWMLYLVDREDLPRGAPVEAADVVGERAAVIALPAYGGAMLGLIAVMATGGALGAALATAFVTGAVGTGFGYLAERSIGQHFEDRIAKQVEAGGLVLWVALADDDEAVVRDTLAEAGGEHIHVNEREAHWGSRDIPLSTGQPDPFL